MKLETILEISKYASGGGVGVLYMVYVQPFVARVVAWVKAKFA